MKYRPDALWAAPMTSAISQSTGRHAHTAGAAKAILIPSGNEVSWPASLQQLGDRNWCGWACARPAEAGMSYDGSSKLDSILPG